MLTARLEPILTQLRAEKREAKSNFEIVRAWFIDHEENLAEDLSDLTGICELPPHERALLAYPVMGNWYLAQMATFDPQTEYQKSLYTLLRGLVLEKRFHNHHTESLHAREEYFNRIWDEFNCVMLSNPSESIKLHELMNSIFCEINGAVFHKRLPQKNTYTVDLGHGFVDPASSFEFLTWYFMETINDGNGGPLDRTIMVVDDSHPKEYYQRMIAVGFQDQAGQQGFFFDCESALNALEKGHYDVILTDLELGEGKMGGIEFVERAYAIQMAKGIKPLISVFSYSDNKLEEAERRLRWKGGNKVFHQVNHNNKVNFSAFKFRFDVCNKL